MLGFGVLAVVAVLILALGGRGANDAPDADTVEALQAEMAASPQEREPAPEQAAPAPAAAPTRPYENTVQFPRQKKIEPEAIAGSWQTAIGRYTAVAQMNEGRFQIIIAAPEPQAPRIYSSGTYRVFDDIVEFTPQAHWPAPTPPPGLSLSYNQLTQASFSFVVTFRGGRMVWQNAPSSERRVYTTLRSPLFMTEDVNFVAWQKMAR